MGTWNLFREGEIPHRQKGGLQMYDILIKSGTL